jgi:hypothetical protein
MAIELPPQIELTQLADGVRYVLPRRQLGGARYVGIVLIAFGFSATGFMIAWMSGAAGTGPGSNDPTDWFAIGFALMGLPGLLVGLGLILVGTMVVLNLTNSEIELRGGKLRSIERFGPFRWTLKRPVASIKQLVVDWALRSQTEHGSSSGTPLDTKLAAIIARGERTRQMILAPGYDRAWLAPLANELASQMTLQTPAKLTGAAGPLVQVPDTSELDESEPAEEIVPDQPAGSNVVLDYRGQGQDLTLKVPPAGLLKGSKGMFVFSFVWLGFMAVFTPMWFLSDNGPSSAEALGLVAFLSLRTPDLGRQAVGGLAR